MKASIKRIAMAVAVLSLVSHLSSCDILGSGTSSVSEGEGQIRLAFSTSYEGTTRSVRDIPDTSDFILTVSNAKGDVVYNGPYGDSPEAIMVESGSYTVSVISEEFTRPAFSSPQFGDEQCVVVPSGSVVNVKLSCRQVNCGVKLDIDKSFLVSCPDGTLFLKSSQGKLMYGYSEKRIAYFSPGDISLILSRGSRDEVLMTRNIDACEILVLGVSVAASSDNGEDTVEKESISVSVDTSRVWLSDKYVIGGSSDKGDDSSDALTVSQAMSAVGEEDVWVCGYIVGGDLTSSSASFEAPFSSATCLLLGPRSSTKDRASCISVQLPAGDVREALNLADNPDLLKKKVRIKGDIVSSYYGLTGLKNCSDYEF